MVDLFPGHIFAGVFFSPEKAQIDALAPNRNCPAPPRRGGRACRPRSGDAVDRRAARLPAGARDAASRSPGPQALRPLEGLLLVAGLRRPGARRLRPHRDADGARRRRRRPLATGGAAWRAGHGEAPSTTYGSARWVRSADVQEAGLFCGTGVVLGAHDGRYPPLPSRTCAITINLVPWNPGNAPDVSWSETSSSGSWPHRSGVPSSRAPPCPRAGRTSWRTVGRLQLRSRSSDLLRFPAFPNCLATATGNDVVCRPIAELPPAERLLTKELADYDANPLDEAKVALHARLADLADANGSTTDGGSRMYAGRGSRGDLP
jgi:hypothetical protein